MTDIRKDFEACMVAALQVVKSYEQAKNMGEPSEGLTDNLAGAESIGDLGAPTPSPATSQQEMRRE